MKKLNILFLSFLYFLYLQVSASPSRVEKLTVNGRAIEVYIPAHLQKGEQYPVLLFTDGQTCFGQQFESMALENLADSMIRNKLISPLFIVAIASDANRMDDYIPYTDSSIFLDFGFYQSRSEDYIRFIQNELLPTLKKKYPLNDRTGIAGFSFGGLFACWAALHHPELFSFSAAFSPSMWVADYKIFEEAKLAKTDQVYYLDIGTAEWNYYIPFVKNSALQPGKNIFYYEVEGAAHMIYYVKKRVHNALLLFAPLQLNRKAEWTIITEVIPSSVQPGRYYRRLNPIISFNNGLTYTLLYNVTYKSDDEETGIVNEDGSFRFLKPADFTVRVSYEGKEKSIRIRYREIEERR